MVARGDALLAPAVTRPVIEACATRPEPDPEAVRALEALTPRELEVLGLLARGRSNGEIAADLVLGEGTVREQGLT